MIDVETEIKNLIIDTLYLEDISPDDIFSDEPLFGEGLGLDSIDSLELGLAVKKHFKVPLDSDSEETRGHFFSVNTLKTFIESHKNS